METLKTTDALLQQLTALLEGGQAHATLAAAVEGFPRELRGSVPAGLPYSAWQILEHLRLAQRDILEFSAPPPGGYTHRSWPAEYWPKSAEPPTSEAWEETMAAINADRGTFVALLTAPGAELYTPFPWGHGENLLREALLMADHNSYHTGELIVIRRLLHAWKP